MDAGVVIVGAGQAGFQVAASLRAGGYQLPVTLIGEEPHLPYQRPPLSKEFLLGKQAIEKAALRPETFFATQNIRVLLGDRVEAIDREKRAVLLTSGAAISYTTLVIATGARVRTLPIDGALYLRGRDDAEQIKARIDAAESVAIVGGGFIGLEIAAAARTLGKSVTVMEAQPRLMARVVAPAISEFYREMHAAHGVEILFGDHAIPTADAVVVGIGVVPNHELAREAGLATANGIAVDEFLRTSDHEIYAIGDCAEHHNPYAGDRVRLESVQNAVDQAKFVASHILGTATAPYNVVPWFWTHQFDVMLQMAGLSGRFDEAVSRGDPASRKFSVDYFKGGVLCAVDSINSAADHIRARRELQREASR